MCPGPRNVPEILPYTAPGKVKEISTFPGVGNVKKCELSWTFHGISLPRKFRISSSDEYNMHTYHCYIPLVSYTCTYIINTYAYAYITILRLGTCMIQLALYVTVSSTIKNVASNIIQENMSIKIHITSCSWIWNLFEISKDYCRLVYLATNGMMHAQVARGNY